MSAHARELFERARAAAAAGRLDDALRAADELCALAPVDLQAARLRAMLLTQGGRDGATQAWQRVLALAPRDAEAHFQLGNAAGDRGDFASAVTHLEAAHATLPNHPHLLNNLGLALEACGRFSDAAQRFRQAMRADARAVGGVRPSLARVLFRAGLHAEALAEIELLISAVARPDAEWLAARAACLAELGRVDAALEAYRAALAADRSVAAIWHDFARFLLAAQRFDDADAVLEDALAALPGDSLVLSLLIASRQRRADWRDVPLLRERLLARIADPRWDGIASGYDFTAICDDPALQRRVAEHYAASEESGLAAALPPRTGDAAGRLRLGFVSSDFRDHPVGRLVVALLERLDRGRFEIVAYSTGPSDGPLGERVQRAAGRFAALPRRDPAAAARIVRDDAIDVLFDLNGFSGGEALRIFAARPAPLQVNFLGYTGTLGTPAYDLIVADAFCIPASELEHYVEQPVFVDPCCYLPSDPAREIGAARARAHYGLPADAVVLNAGSALYKVSPELFDAWLAVLRDVPRAVVWLRDAPTAIAERLRAAAAAHGVDPGRLHFAPREALPDYLARLALCDVFLDSTPFGSHTSVNDALFMGLPVVTVPGRSFAGRASASQLRSAGLDDLVAADLAQYVQIASAIAADAGRLAACRQRLHGVRARPLFDADLYAARFAEAISVASARR